MKTIIYILLTVIIFASCEKEEVIELKSASNDIFTIDSIKKIEWRGYLASEVVINKFINDSILMIKYIPYIAYNTINPESQAVIIYDLYKITDDSLYLKYNTTSNYNNPTWTIKYDVYGYKANNDSLVMSHSKSKTTFTYFSKKQRGAY